jgi:predicted Zn-dependent peptidase
VTAAGNLTHACLADLAARYLGELPPGERVPESQRPRTHAGITLRNKRSLEQMHVCLGVPSYPLSHESRFVSYILNTMLGGGMSSRLFQNIREKQGLAYSVFSELNPYRDTGCLAVYAGTSPAAARQVIDSILEQFRLLKQEPVPADELQRAKDHLKGSLLLGMESTASRMANLARQEIYFQRQIPIEEMLERIERVTAEDVQLCARELFDPKQIALTMLGNLNGLQVRREDLEC